MLALINQILAVILACLIFYAYTSWKLEKWLQEDRQDWFYFDFKRELTKQLMNKTIEKLRRCAELKLQ